MDENKPQPNNQDGLKTVKTYMSDMADTVRANEISVIKVALAEQNKHEREDLYRKAEGTPIKKTFWIIGGVIFILGAIYGSYLIIKAKEKNNAPVETAKVETVISFDETTSIDLTNETDFLTKINAAKSTKSTVTSKTYSIKYIALEKNTNGIKEGISVKDLFDGMSFNAPSSLIRSLSDSYMIGTYTTGIGTDKETTPSLFIILPTKNYEYTYAGMLEWEQTLAGDMLNLFEFKNIENKSKANTLKFKDLILNNKDSRVLLDGDEKPILYYMFINNNLIITDSKDTIKEIESRLAIKNIKPL